MMTWRLLKVENEPNESEVVKALKEQFEKELQKQKEEYEKKLADQKKDYTETIKTILTTGAVRQPDVPEPPQEENEEDIALANLRKKFKITK